MEFFMKKSILASSIAAAVFGLGATGAQAAIVASTTGIGDLLIVPYYTAQAENATLLTITNTDVTNGKAVKVRFRGAQNSDDVADFQVFLSPADVWSVNVSKGADGKAKLTTTDASCTKPANVNQPFSTVRLDAALPAAESAKGTLEGYIEIIGMADIPKSGSGTPTTSSSDTTNPLFTSIKHVASKAPCSGTLYSALDKLTQGSAPAATTGLVAPTGGLMANWVIINTANQAAWNGEAYALKTADTTGTKLNTYVSQMSTPVPVANLAAATADPLFLTGAYVAGYSLSTQTFTKTYISTVQPIVNAAYYDLPDMSTPVDSDYASPVAQVNAIQAVLAKTNVIAEFATESAISGSTDWQFSMPTRRYAVAMAYSKKSSSDDGRRFNAQYQQAAVSTAGDVTLTLSSATAVFNAANTTVTSGGVICVTGSGPTAYDREENTATSGVVMSPQVLGNVSFCGESSVLAWNNGVASSALKATLTIYPVDVSPFQTGWASMSTKVKANDNTTDVGLPFVGGAFLKASNGTAGYGVYQPYR